MPKPPFQLAAVLLLALAAPLLACNVPVFRYALERWNPDAYEVFIFHQGPLTAEQQKLVAAMQSQITGTEQQLDSFYIHEVDVTLPLDDKTRAVHAAVKPAGYPHLVVQFPRSHADDPPAYSGPMTREAVTSLADSPARRQAAKLILAGESVVWLLLESGDRAKDDAAASLLTKELDRLGKELALPELDETDDKFFDPEAGPKLRMSFALLRLSRKAPGEAMFIRLLENWDPKSVDRGEPMAFALFGRGRVMPPLKGKHLTAGFIEEACTFLVGRCSCQVKEENPGWDLLMPVNWDAVMRGQASLTEAMPMLTTPGAVVERNEAIAAVTEKALAAVGEPAQPLSPTKDTAMLRNVMILVGVGLVLTIAGTMWLRMRRV